MVTPTAIIHSAECPEIDEVNLANKDVWLAAVLQIAGRKWAKLGRRGQQPRPVAGLAKSCAGGLGGQA